MEDTIYEKETNTTEAIRANWVTILLIILNVGIFFILETIGNTEDADFMLRYGANYPDAVLEKQYWRLLTAAFLHFGFQHLLNNMVMLGCAGHYLEEALGHMRYLLLYLLSAVGGNLFSCMQMYLSGDYAVAAGASGGIFAIVGALLWVIIRHKGNYESLTTRGMLFLIAMCLFYGIMTAGVDNWGHLGGLISGVFLGIILYRIKPKRIDLDEGNQYT